jgi:Predicted integral membrane protein
MKNKWIKHIIMVLITISPLLYMLIVWDTIPDEVNLRTSYGFTEGRDAVSLESKNGLWGAIGLLVVVILVVYGLAQNIKLFDPKRTDKPFSNVFNKISVGMVILLTAMNFVILLDNIGRIENAPKLMMPIVGVLFAFLGNTMHNIKPNYYIGLRLPWTLNSDDNWRKTHQLAGKLWFAGGLLFAISYIIKPELWSDRTFFLLIVVLVLVPSAYSFMLFRKEKSQTSN